MGGREELKAQEMVSEEAIKQSDSMVLVQTEKKLIAQVYEDADFPRDFRIRIVHRGTPLEGQRLIEVYLNVVDGTNPSLPDDGWFLEKQHPARGTAGGGFVHGGIAQDINQQIESIYNPVIQAQLKKSQELKDFLKLDENIRAAKEWAAGHTHTSNQLELFDEMQWAGGTFVQVVDEQVLLKAKRDEDLRLIEEQAYQMAHEAMRRQAMKESVPLSHIRCTHYTDYDPMMFRRRYVCRADPVRWIPSTGFSNVYARKVPE